MSDVDGKHQRYIDSVLVIWATAIKQCSVATVLEIDKPLSTGEEKKKTRKLLLSAYWP